MYPVALAVNVVARFERTGRRRALERERTLQQERIELSQTIHDTAAQVAYIIGLGLEHAIELADDEQDELKQTLGGLSDLSKSGMWEVRQPIDMGLIFEDQSLSRVLDTHAQTFTTITSLRAELAQSGVEPP